MDNIAQQLIPLLKAKNIPFYEHGTSLRIPLPNDFGEIEISDLEGGDDIIGLVDEEWHTHGDMLAGYGGDSRAESIAIYLQQIFAGKLYLVEELKDGKRVSRYIKNDLTGLHKRLPKGYAVKIYNKA